MWDPDDDKLEAHAKTSSFSKSPGFSLEDAFSEDDAVDAALEFNPATIRAALARTLGAGGFESSENQTDDGNDGRGTDTGVSSHHPNHDRNGSGVEDPDASVSTLDINASPVRVLKRTPEEWSRSTSYSHGYGYRQDSASGIESLENFSRISLSDSVHGLESVGISPEEQVVQERDGEGDTEEAGEGLFHAVHIDLSQGGRPRVEEVTVSLPEPSSPCTPNRDGARTPSPKSAVPPPLPSASSNRGTYTPPSTSTPTSNVFPNHQSQSQSVPEFPSPTTYRRSAEETYTGDGTNHIPPDSAGTVLSASSPVFASSATTPGSVPTQDSTDSPSNSSRSEPHKRGHRPSRSVGPSALDKVISKTRPSFLPPKPKTEDLKHMADWEAMMKQSRAAGEFHLGSLVWFLCHLFMPWEDSSVLTFSSFLSNCERPVTLPSPDPDRATWVCRETETQSC